MQFYKFITVVASSLLAQPGVEGVDLEKEPFLREMVHELELLQVEMNLTATAEPAFEPSFFRSQAAMQAGEVDLVKRMVEYAGASYCLDLTLKSWTCLHCQHPESVELITVVNDKTSGGRGYVAVDHSMQSIVVAFQGSADPRNFLNDFNFGLADLEVGDGTQYIKVHTGFLKYTESLSRFILPAVEDLLAKYNYTVTLTGHSLGGAIATLTSVYVNKFLGVAWSDIGLVTFGEPRIGNLAFARWFNAQSQRHLRVVNNRDMVVHLPLNAVGYFHRKREIFLSNGAMHSCTSNDLEDDDCANSMTILNIWDHLSYLGITMGLVC